MHGVWMEDRGVYMNGWWMCCVCGVGGMCVCVPLIKSLLLLARNKNICFFLFLKKLEMLSRYTSELEF